MYAATGDTAVYNRLNYMLNELHRAQQAVGTGFIGGTPGSLQLWKDIKAGNIRAGGFDLNGKWVPLYNIHKTMPDFGTLIFMQEATSLDKCWLILPTG